MLNKELDFARVTIHIQQVEEKKKKISEAREVERQEKKPDQPTRVTVSLRVVSGEINGRKRRTGVMRSLLPAPQYPDHQQTDNLRVFRLTIEPELRILIHRVVWLSSIILFHSVRLVVEIIWECVSWAR